MYFKIRNKKKQIRMRNCPVNKVVNETGFGGRVARWYIVIPKMPIMVYFGRP
jgi:hypothetical protein